MVGRHEIHRGAAQQPHGAVRARCGAPAQHQLQKARVVAGGGHQPAASRLEHGRGGHVDQRHFQAGLRVECKGLGQAVLLRCRHRKTGVVHAQRAEHAPLQDGAQRLALDHLQHSAQHIGGAAVFPAGAGGVYQRQRAECGRQLGVVVAARSDARGAVGVGHGAQVPGVAQAGGVAQQVVHGGLARGGGGGARGRVVHLLRGKGGQVAGHRVRQQQAALFHQHHRHQRGDGLGHRVDAKHRVRRHGGRCRFGGGRALVAHGLVQHGLAPVVHQGHGAGQQALVHMGLQHGAQAGEGLRVHGFKHFWPPALDV